jgi:hypothetical protein
MWVDYDGVYLLVNTNKPLQKERNLRRDPRVELSIQDPDDPYCCLAVRGPVVEMTEEGAEEHIDKLAQKSLGTARYEDAHLPGLQSSSKFSPSTSWPGVEAPTLACGHWHSRIRVRTDLLI